MPTLQPTETLSELLHRVFGHRDFRPHQQIVCEAAAAGRDVLLVMPTGAGKSLCYQLPALARRTSEQAGTALVISPLIALMDDQAAKLTALGLRVARVHSGLSRDDARQACRDYLTGSLDFLFIAPERMRVPGFPEMLARRKPVLVAIDEAHCISAWGHDFRPDYRTLGQYLPALRPAPIIALTATATPTVQRDIALQLNLHNPAIFITGFRRHNLAIQAIELSKPQRPDFALKLLQQPNARPAIVYAGSRKDAEEFASKFHKHFPTAAYHAGLDPTTRDRVQRAFLSGKLDVVVATVAFGMGVDKADVRTVIHVALPGSVEAYYQEIGRAGRDGQPSRTVLLHGFADRRLQEFFLEKNYPPISDLERVAVCLPTEFTPVDALHNALLKKRTPIDRETLDRTIEKLLVAGVALMDMNGDVRRADDQSSTDQSIPEHASFEGDGLQPVHQPSPIERGFSPRGKTRPPWQSAYETQVAIRRAQIDSMIAFAESTTCRMAALVQHFGDTTDKALPCGLCDICNPGGHQADNDDITSSFSRQPTADQREGLRSILAAIDTRATSTGKLFEQVNRDRNPSPCLRDRKDFDALVNGLARAALVTITKETFIGEEGNEVSYRRVAITREGRLTGVTADDDRTLDTVWIRDSSTSASTRKFKQTKKPKSGAPSSPMASSSAKVGSQNPRALNPAAEQLFQQLRNWRTEQARPNHTPAFMILSDAVLRAIATTAPQNLTALHAISGVGPSKVDRYGADLIAICRGDLAPTPAPPLRPKSLPSQPEQQPLPSRPTQQSVSSRPKRSEVERPAVPATTTSAVHQNKRAAPTPPPADLTPAQQALEARLKDWRREAAKSAGLPTFFIFSDTVLRNITLIAPTTLDELRNIRGASPEKLAQFGPTILSLCRP